MYAPAVDREWIAALKAEDGDAIARLHDLLLRAARHEVNRRAATLPHLRGNDLGDLAEQSAGDALVAVLAKLDTFRGESRFTTWVYKFALYEAAVKLRKRAWQGREVPLEPDTWQMLAAAGESPAGAAEGAELLAAIREAIEKVLTPRQREVLLALTVGEVPIDVLADRLDTTRGALYKMLHDARRKLRAHLGDQGLMP